MSKIPSEMIHNRIYDTQPLAYNALTPGRPFNAPEVEIPVGAAVQENGDVVFSLYAPTAQDVQCMLPVEGRKVEVTKDANGIWSGVLPYQASGPKATAWSVDGVSVINAYSPIQFGQLRAVNYVDIPDPKQDFVLIRDIPHGTVSHGYYFSKVTQGWETCIVYTPPGYEASGEDYPVLYLQHGHGENETSWVWLGKVNFIMDNLIAEGKAVPSVIVMNNGMVKAPINEIADSISILGDMLLKDCIPYIEKKYRVKTDKWSRAMAGLSMGSMQTSMTVLTNPDKFGYFGLFSCFLRVPGKPFEESPHLAAFDHLEKFEKDFRLFWRGWGTEDNLVEHMKADDAFLAEKHASPEELSAHKRVLYPGRHDWHVWRNCIHDFLQLLFK